MNLRRSATIWIISVTIVAGLLVLSFHVSAHKPIFNNGGPSFEEPFEISDIKTSLAIYGELRHIVAGNPDGAQFFKFEADAGDPFYFQMNIPDIEGHMFFAPDVLLVGPGLPYPNASVSMVLSIVNLTIPSGAGVVRYSHPLAENGTIHLPWTDSIRSGPPEFEPFGQVAMWTRQEVRATLPASGTYYIVVLGVVITQEQAADEEFVSNLPSKYLLAPGELEEFGILDYVLIPVDWIQIRMFWGQNPLIFLLPTIITVVVGLVATGLWLRRKNEDFYKSQTRSRQAAFFLGVGGSLLMLGGGINQIIFLFFSAHSDVSGIALLVLFLQLVAVVVGLVCVRLVQDAVSEKGLGKIVKYVALTVVAMVSGAGFVLGPLVFLGVSTSFVLRNSLGKGFS